MATVHYTIDDVMKELKSINNKLDNFLGFENVSDEEKIELIKIKKEMLSKKYSTYDDVFN